MKKLFLLFLIFLILMFIVPMIFTRPFLSTAIKEQADIAVSTIPQEEKIEPYDYKEHSVIKLLHKNDNSIEEIRLR